MRKTKLLVLLCATVLMLVSLLAIGSAAEEKVLKIDSANVAYNDMMHLVFTLENTNLVPEGAEAGIIVWDKAQDEFLVSNARFATFTHYSDGTVTYYKSYGVAAPQIGTEIYIAACYIADEVITVTQTPVSYSLVEYFVSRLNKNVELYQAELYESVLTYGAASDKVLADNAFVLVKANGGYVGNYNRACGAAKEAGESFILRAPAENAEGNYFIKWVDSKGNTVSEERVFTVTPETTGLVVYTAVYGTLAESPYAKIYGFDTVEAGELEFVVDTSTAPSVECYGDYSGTNMRRWRVNNTDIVGLTVTNCFLPVATKDDAAAKDQRYTFVKDDDGKYIVDCGDKSSIVETRKADNALLIERGQNGSGWETYFTSTSGTTVTEFDLGTAGLTEGGVQIYANIRLSDGSKTADYRLNLDTTATTPASGTFYAERPSGVTYQQNALYGADGKIYSYSFNAGETLTIKIALNITGENPVLDIYCNGTYIGSLACSQFKSHNASLDFSKAYVSYLEIETVTAADDAFYIDNVCFR